MVTLPGYAELDFLNETLSASDFRSVCAATGETVLIKLIKTERAPPADIARLKHEFELIRKSAVEGVVKILDIVTHEERLALVLEDFKGIPLKRHFPGTFPLSRILNIGIRLSGILENLHAHNFIHRCITPAAILFDPETDTLKLTCFGIAAELAGWSPEVVQEIVETLAYMSPEQTGRMNCAVDYRTDLYSLGIVLYESLTGAVPFQSRDPLEIIHAHMARMPLAPYEINPNIPPVLSDIVMRLLAKAAEERYQSGQGLMRDLIECRYNPPGYFTEIQYPPGTGWPGIGT